jgi:hypothetical protein
MGTLRSTEVVFIPNEDPDLPDTPMPACQGLVINGVLLGDPVEIDGDPNTYEWNDGAFPDGVVYPDGTVVPDGDPVE